jgi:hypothetical protein
VVAPVLIQRKLLRRAWCANVFPNGENVMKLDDRSVLRLALAIALTAIPGPSAHGLDLHDYWDKNCANCHGHAAAFARQFLAVKNGKLLGRHHVDNLEVFLLNHYLRRDLIEPVSQMLKAQVSTEPRFRKECGGCHENAATLARQSLTLHDGVLVSRSSGRPTAEFLSGHARIKQTDISFFVEVLMRVVKEVGAQ